MEHRTPGEYLIVSRASAAGVALETTLLVHGVPRDQSVSLNTALSDDVRAAGGDPALVGVLRGRAVVGMNDDELRELLDAGEVPKLNTANLGLCLHRQGSGATTVSATMELAARAGVRVFATGGIGGVHRGYAHHLDISADLAALARFPVAVVCSGVKSILDVAATREALETLGVPVVGFEAHDFPAFYLRSGDAGAVDARFDDPADLASYVDRELARTGRGVLIANPIPASDELNAQDWARWLAEAERRAVAQGAHGRAVTPAVLGALHEVSSGATLKANIALVRSNARLAGAVAASLPMVRRA